jgi:hypothetical protein
MTTIPRRRSHGLPAVRAAASLDGRAAAERASDHSARGLTRRASFAQVLHGCPTSIPLRWIPRHSGFAQHYTRTANGLALDRAARWQEK